jgi:hypothetical protein
MGRRSCWISGGVALAVLVACVTWANVMRIEVGMTQPEVEAVVGCQPQAWSPGPVPIGWNPPPGYRKVLLWSDAECYLLVYLDRDGRVIGRDGVRGWPPSWYDRLRPRLGLQSRLPGGK